MKPAPLLLFFYSSAKHCYSTHTSIRLTDCCSLYTGGSRVASDASPEVVGRINNNKSVQFDFRNAKVQQKTNKQERNINVEKQNPKWVRSTCYIDTSRSTPGLWICPLWFWSLSFLWSQLHRPLLLAVSTVSTDLHQRTGKARPVVRVGHRKL